MSGENKKERQDQQDEQEPKLKLIYGRSLVPLDQQAAPSTRDRYLLSAPGRVLSVAT